MMEQSGTAGKSAGENVDGEPKVLGVEDIPGAIIPAADEPQTGAGAGQAGLNERLAAFRERRAAAGATGGAAAGHGPGARNPGGGRGAGRMGGGGGMAGGGQGRRRGGGAAGGPAPDADPIEAAKKVLAQLSTRAANAGEEKRGLKFAIQNIQSGFQALEQEVERLNQELARAHEAVRSVQGQGD